MILRTVKIGFLFLIILLLFIFHPLKCFAGKNKWTKVGQICTENIGGKFSSVVINPSNPKILYAVVNDSLVKKSTNKGNEWKNFNNGLDCKKVNELQINPFFHDIVYACTDNGLFVFEKNKKQWSTIGFSDTSVFALAVDLKQPHNIKYTATKNSIFRKDEKNNWKLIPFDNDWKSNIYAITMSPDTTSNFIFIGTENGIYKAQDVESTIKLLGKAQENQRKIIDFFIDLYHTQIIFMASASGGIFWADSQTKTWHPMNEGWEANAIPKIFNISTDYNRLDNIYTSDNNGKIYNYNLNLPEIAIVDFTSQCIAPWEIERISNYLFSELKSKYYVRLFPENVLKPIDPIKWQIVDIKKFGEQNGFKIIITGYASEFGANSDKINMKCMVTHVDSKIRRYPFVPKPQKKDDYFPDTVNQIRDYIFSCIEENKNCINKYFWNKPMKLLYKGLLGGTALYLLHKLKIDDSENGDDKEKSLPDPVP